MHNPSIRVPGIVTDIDGVLVRGKAAVKGAADAIRFLKTPLNQIDRERYAGIEEPLPFVCLTNAGGMERQKAEAVSNWLGLQGPAERLTGQEVIMNYTPLRSIMQEYSDRMILISGIADADALAEDLGLQKYITDEEYCRLFPVLVSQEEVPDGLKKKVAERLNIVDEDAFDEPFQVHAIFIVKTPPCWDERIQLICDLLSTPDGRIAEKMPEIGLDEHIPVYCANNDATTAKAFRLPRITFGCFNESLKQVYKLVYKRELELKLYGKPSQRTFDYTEKHVKGLTNMEISNFYMIGDNPKSDIRGGNNAGWTTILVKTGIFQQTEEYANDPENPATYVVEDFAAAVRLICELEGINCGIEAS